MSDSKSAGDLRTKLRAAEAGGREGSEAPEIGGTGSETELVRHAYRVGCVQRVLAMGRDTAVAQKSDEGLRYQIAEIAIELSAARELVWRAKPDDPFTVALAGVAVREAMTAAFAASVAVIDDDRWPAFWALRAAAEQELRVDRTGSSDLEAVAGALLAGRVALGGH